MKFEDIALHIEQSIPSLIRGRNLFVNQMPADIEGILLKESYAGTEIDPYMPNMRRGNFQLVARGRDYAATKQLIESVASTLNMQERNFAQIRIKTCVQMSEPVSFMISEGGMTEFSVKFFAVYDIVGK
ncbi:minor capsid protein [Methyloversatilis sp.]|uniref:phage tail terminator protein n=1 Tax=Methyloversatilis sp. TaxID=2569862 RepID=UPI0035ADF192